MWLGMRDSNPRMSAPKADALPLGESPTYLCTAPTYYTATEVIAQALQAILLFEHHVNVQRAQIVREFRLRSNR